MSALREFQRSFAQAILEPHTTSGNRFGAGLAVYRNTVAKGLVDVLRANFPTVVRLTGDEWFDAVALCYARDQLPAQPSLALYGASFPDFLEQTLAGRLPYLSSVAGLDRLWTEAHFAADASTLQAQQLALLSAQQLGTQKLLLHPATRFMRCANSAVTIWRANRPPAAPPNELEVADANEAVLITRPHGQVHIESLSLVGYEFLLHLRAGNTLGAAADALLAVDASSDIATLLATLLVAGTFSASGITTNEENEETSS